MLKGQINRFAKRYGWLRLIQVALGTGAVILGSVLILQLVVPVRLSFETVEAFPGMNATGPGRLSEILQSKTTGFEGLAMVTRMRLFKSATPLRDKPMADKTIERIRSQLKLQCIMEMNGEPVAYVNIKGVGLKKCKVGDTVGDLFTVLNISKKSIEITIVDHRVTLSL